MFWEFVKGCKYGDFMNDDGRVINSGGKRNEKSDKMVESFSKVIYFSQECYL